MIGWGIAWDAPWHTPAARRARNNKTMTDMLTDMARTILSKVSVWTMGALALSTLLGLAVGVSFNYAGPVRAWDNLIAGFLWVLIVATAAALARFFRERVRRGEWRRGLAIMAEVTLLPTTVFILMVGVASIGAAEVATLPDGARVASRPNMLALAPIFYGVALVLALALGPLCILTSPFRAQPEALPYE